jgi:hypothetical protein
MEPISKREPVVIVNTEPLRLAGMVYRMWCARRAQLGTRFNARSEVGTGVMA